jgi:hypothetical protein
MRKYRRAQIRREKKRRAWVRHNRMMRRRLLPNLFRETPLDKLIREGKEKGKDG